MLKTDQMSSYSRHNDHNDYYQLWLDKKKENQSLITHLLDSKKVITALHLKLTDILNCIKIFEVKQGSVSFNLQDHESSDEANVYVPTSQNIAPEVPDPVSVTPEKRGEVVEMVSDPENVPVTPEKRSELLEMVSDPEISTKTPDTPSTVSEAQSDTLSAKPLNLEVPFKPYDLQDSAKQKNRRKQTFLPREDMPTTSFIQQMDPPVIIVDSDDESSPLPNCIREHASSAVPLPFGQNVSPEVCHQQSVIKGKRVIEYVDMESESEEPASALNEAAIREDQGSHRKRPRVQEEDISTPAGSHELGPKINSADKSKSLGNLTMNVFERIKTEPVEEVDMSESSLNKSSESESHLEKVPEVVLPTENVKETAVQLYGTEVTPPLKRIDRLRNKATIVWQDDSSEEPEDYTYDPDYMGSPGQNPSFSEKFKEFATRDRAARNFQVQHHKFSNREPEKSHQRLSSHTSPHIFNMPCSSTQIVGLSGSEGSMLEQCHSCEQLRRENEALMMENSILQEEFKTSLREVPEVMTLVKSFFKDREKGPLSIMEAKEDRVQFSEGMMELYPHTGVLISTDDMAEADRQTSCLSYVRSILLSLFPVEVLLVSNLRGGPSKNCENKGNTALDPRKINALYSAALRKFPDTPRVAVGCAINSKICELRYRKKSHTT